MVHSSLGFSKNKHFKIFVNVCLQTSLHPTSFDRYFIISLPMLSNFGYDFFFDPSIMTYS